MNSKDIATAGILAATYTALVWVFQPISFLQYQVRIADALTGVIPLTGWAGIIGLTIGTFLANTISPLGVIDLLSTIPEFMGLMILLFTFRKMGDKGVIIGLLIMSIIISSWVAFMLEFVLGIPFLIGFINVLIGSLIAIVLLGYIVYKALDKVGRSIA